MKKTLETAKMRLQYLKKKKTKAGNCKNEATTFQNGGWTLQTCCYNIANGGRKSEVGVL